MMNVNLNYLKKLPSLLFMLGLYFFTVMPTRAQNDSIVFIPATTLTVKKRPVFLKQLIVPGALVIAGAWANKRQFEKSVNKNVLFTVGHNFHTKVDDYLRYAPIAELYAADALGIKGKNHWFDQTKNLAISIIVTDFITAKLKKLTKKTRPNGGKVAHSFPSAHSSLAFANATVLYEEFIDTSPTFAYTGYGFAVATGSLRLMNNAHWLSDVMVGAAIGIVVTKLVYLLDPIIKWNPFKDTNNLVLIPKFDDEGYGLILSKRF